jgi:hypothetical protein
MNRFFFHIKRHWKQEKKIPAFHFERGREQDSSNICRRRKNICLVIGVCCPSDSRYSQMIEPTPKKKETELKRVIVTEYSQRNNWYLVARTRAAQANRVGRRVFALLLLLLKTKLEPATSSTCIPGEGVVITSPVRAGSRPAFPPPGCTARESWARRRCQ